MDVLDGISARSQPSAHPRGEETPPTLFSSRNECAAPLGKPKHTLHAFISTLVTSISNDLTINNDLNYKIMKNKEFWKSVIQLVISVLTAALTAISTTSCMGHGPIYM